MSGHRGRAGVWHARPRCICMRRAAAAGGKVFRHGSSASDELPSLMAELIIIEVATTRPGDTEPPAEPAAAA